MTRVAVVDLNLRTKAADVNRNRTNVALEFPAPDVLEELFAAEDLLRMLGKEKEEIELAGGEGDGMAVTEDGAAGWIDLKVAGADAALGLVDGGSGTAEDGVDAGDEFSGAEGFDDVVVGAHLEAGEALGLGGACGEHDDGDVGGLADAAAHLFAGQFGEHEIEDDEVGGVRFERGERVRAGGRGGDFVAVLFEVEAYDISDRAFVIDDEDRSHSPPVGHHSRLSTVARARALGSRHLGVAGAVSSMLGRSSYETVTARGRSAIRETRSGGCHFYAGCGGDGRSARCAQRWRIAVATPVMEGAESTMTAYREFLVEQIGRDTATVQAFVEYFPADRWEWSAGPKLWPAREHLNHVRNVELRYLERLEGVLAAGEYVPEARPREEPGDPSEPIAAIVEAFAATRALEVAALAGLSASQWAHTFDHPTLWGRVSVEWWAERIVEHTAQHIDGLWMVRQLSAVAPERVAAFVPR